MFKRLKIFVAQLVVFVVVFMRFKRGAIHDSSSKLKKTVNEIGTI